MRKFYKLLDESRGHKVTATETRECKTRVINNSVNLYDFYLDFYEKDYHKSALNEKEGSDSKQLKIVGMSYQNSWNQNITLMKQRDLSMILELTLIMSKYVSRIKKFLMI